MKEFSIKDLEEAKTIIEWEIICEEGILKINQKRYVWDLLEFEKMTSYYSTILPIKIGSTFILNQVGYH